MSQIDPNPLTFAEDQTRSRSPITTDPLPASRKIYAEGTLSGSRQRL